MLSRLIGEEIKVWLDLEAGAPAILGDGTQVEQVLMNLAINARDAMPRGGRLTIEVAQAWVDRAVPGGPPPGPWVRLSVVDTGTGMTPDVAARAFEPFFTTKERGKGTGLGLATVYGVVHQHGGHVQLKTVPGKGTRFDLYFPPAGPLARGAATGVPAHPAEGGGETVLVVDDEPSVRRVIRVILERHGYLVMEAASGEEALGALDMAVDQVDVLLSDVIMPGMRGPELARAFQARCPGRPVLLMSGYTDGATEEGDGVADAFITKPLTPEKLAQAVRQVLDAG
jgi:CheY-like chemotaxis protein